MDFAIANVSIAAAVAAGAVSFLSPCILPLVPGYVSFIAGSSGSVATSRLRTATVSLCSTLGFATIFVALGASATFLSRLLRLGWRRRTSPAKRRWSCLGSARPGSCRCLDGVRKPIFSREGANVTLVRDGRTESVDGPYGEGPFVIQGAACLFASDAGHAVIGSWVVGDEPAGIGIREGASAITVDLSRFVPHVIVRQGFRALRSFVCTRIGCRSLRGRSRSRRISVDVEAVDHKAMFVQAGRDW